MTFSPQQNAASSPDSLAIYCGLVWYHAMVCQVGVCSFVEATGPLRRPLQNEPQARHKQDPTRASERRTIYDCSSKWQRPTPNAPAPTRAHPRKKWTTRWVTNKTQPRASTRRIVYGATPGRHLAGHVVALQLQHCCALFTKSTHEATVRGPTH